MSETTLEPTVPSSEPTGEINPPLAIPNPPPVLSPTAPPTKGEVKITDKNSPFFDRIFSVIEQDEEHVVCLIKVGLEHLFHVFTKGQTTPKEDTAVVSTVEEEAAKK